MRRAVGVLLVLLVSACGAGAGAQPADERLLVAAASDLQPAFSELGERFRERTGTEVTFTFGSSGQLAQQILEGAPMDLFASANAAYVDRLVDAGRADATTRTTYAFGRIVIWSRADAWGGWDGLAALLADDDVRALAIANPSHAPYGLAARQALEAAGMDDAAAARLVYGESVSDAHRMAASGNADAVVTALSLAVAAPPGEGHWMLVPERLHAPLRQDLVVVGDPERVRLAARFVELIDSAEGRGVMRRYGFLLPGDEPPPSWGD
jgi:molybdate transport system substrate-binding protein